MTKLDPIWKQAVEDFLSTDPKPGDLITREWLEKAFELKRPKSGTWEEIHRYDLRFLSMRENWADNLLRKHGIQFTEKERDADGWRVLAPGDVVAFTRKRSVKELAKALRRDRERLAFNDLAALTPAQLREHAEALVRNSWKAQALRDADKKPVPLPQQTKALPGRPDPEKADARSL